MVVGHMLLCAGKFKLKALFWDVDFILSLRWVQVEVRLKAG